MIKTTLFVTIIAVLEKFLGFLYRIILSRTLGSEGLGIYQIALSVFGVLITITCSGIPITVSRLMAKYRTERNNKAINGTITAGIILGLSLSVPIFCVMFFGRNFFGFLFSDERCLTIFAILITSLVCSSIYSVFHGVFWGNKDFTSFCLVELIEEVTMIILGVILVTNMKDIFDGAKRIAFAVIISYFVSFLLALILFISKKGKLGKPKKYFKPLIKSALPITGMRTISSLVSSLIAIIFPLVLCATGMSKSEALSEFGMAFGMAIPVLFIPSTLIGSLSVVLVPELAENYYKHNNSVLKRNIEKAIKFAVIVACLLVPVFITIGKDVGIILFGNVKSGKYISYSAIIMLPLSISMITTSMLNSIGSEKHSLIYYSIGASFMLLSILFLPKFVGSYALAIGFFLSFTIDSLLNLRLLTKKSRVNLHYKKFTLLAILFMLPSVVLGGFVYKILNIYVSAFFCASISGIITLAINFVLYLVFDMLSIKDIIAMFKFTKKTKATQFLKT